MNKFVAAGQLEGLNEVAEDKVRESGFLDSLKKECAKLVSKKGANASVSEVIALLKARAEAAVLEEKTAELQRRIAKFVLSEQVSGDELVALMERLAQAKGIQLDETAKLNLLKRIWTLQSLGRLAQEIDT